MNRLLKSLPVLFFLSTPVWADDIASMYGSPAMYGEYNAREMYGMPAAPVTQPSPVVTKKEKPKPLTAQAKKPKPVVKKTAAIKPKPEPAVEQPVPVVVKPELVPIVTAPKPMAKPEPVPEVKPVATSKPEPILPDSKAQNIVSKLNEKPFNVDTYCTTVNPAVTGKLPPGLVLMPGRPDQMSCVKN